MQRHCARVIFGMNYLPYLQNNSAGGRIRKEWSKDTPLPVAEGGTTEAVTPSKYLAFEPHFRQGGTLTGLVCLTDLNNDFDSKTVVQDGLQIEKLARILFTDGQAAEADPKDLLNDEWYNKHNTVFPRSFSEKETIPVIVRDLSRMPASWRMLGMCELVCAFWKTVDRVGTMKDALQRDIDQGGLTSEQET